MSILSPRIILTAVVFSLVGASAVLVFQNPDVFSVGPASARSGTVRYYDLVIAEQDIDMGNGAVWHAWTFNHTVPGPTIEATVGDVVRVTVRNTMSSMHSFHTHFSPYSVANDGSQINMITGIGGMAMIPANGSYTYEFLANIPGLFYYHDHSTDGGGSIHANIAQGLYGAIIVRGVDEPPVDDQVVVMGERGFDVSSPDAPFFIMNGKGLPGGEKTLETTFEHQGLPGVVAHVGTTIPVLTGRVGVPLRINVINIGDVVHTFHLHAMTAYLDDGKPLPAQVLGLDPGEAGRLTVTPTEAGLWLFHCHVVSHADAGMIGIFMVQPRTGSLDLPAPSTNASSSPRASSHHGATPSDGVPGDLTVAAGGTNELRFSSDRLTAAAPGLLTLDFKNAGKTMHSIAFPSLRAETPSVPPGGVAKLELNVAEPGDYEFICTIPGHADAGMRGTLTVKSE